jgi:predicted N-acetyltransferase YhbS
VPDIRTGHASEATVDLALELVCRAFDLDIEAARPLFYADPFFSLEDKWLLWDGDRAVSTATIVPCAMNMGGWTMACAGIAGVATDPRSQGRGHAMRLIGDMLLALRERGFAMAALFAERPDLYDRLGFSPAARRWSVSFEIPELSGSEYPHELSAADREEIVGLHRRFAGHRLGAVERDVKRWGYVFWRNPSIVGVGRPLYQYMICAPAPNGLFVRELIPPGPAEPMLRFLAGKGTIEVQGWREDVEAWRSAVSRVWPVGSPKWVDDSTEMWRVLDAGAALRSVARLRPEVEGDVSVEDPLIEANRAAWRVVNGELRAATPRAPGIGIRDLALGLATGADALPRGVGALSALLPPKRVFCLFPCDTF